MYVQCPAVHVHTHLWEHHQLTPILTCLCQLFFTGGRTFCESSINFPLFLPLHFLIVFGYFLNGLLGLQEVKEGSDWEVLQSLPTARVHTSLFIGMALKLLNPWTRYKQFGQGHSDLTLFRSSIFQPPPPPPPPRVGSTCWSTGHFESALTTSPGMQSVDSSWCYSTFLTLQVLLRTQLP